MTLHHNTSLQHFPTTFLHNTSPQHSFTTPPHKTSLHSSTTLLYDTSPQHFSATLPHNTSPQHFSTTLLHNTPSQRFTTTLLHTPSQHFTTTILHTPSQHFSTNCKVLRLPGENDTLALTRFQSIAAVTRNAIVTSHLVSFKLQNEHFVRDALHFSYLKDMIMAHCVCTAHRREINDATRTRRGIDDDDQHDANTGPAPDPNYKREPFATHSGKKLENMRPYLSNFCNFFAFFPK